MRGEENNIYKKIKVDEVNVSMENLKKKEEETMIYKKKGVGQKIKRNERELQ